MRIKGNEFRCCVLKLPSVESVETGRSKLNNKLNIFSTVAKPMYLRKSLLNGSFSQ